MSDAGHDILEPLARALRQSGEVVARVRPEQASLPTPCRGWDVSALVSHLVGDVRTFTVMVDGSDWDTTPDPDLAGDDWAAGYQQTADGLLAAWRRQVAIDEKAVFRLGQQTADLVVHAWDVARATGQSTDLDADLAQRSLDWARQALQPQFRGEEGSGKSFGPEVSIADDAPVNDRLAAFFGRHP